MALKGAMLTQPSLEPLFQADLMFQDDDVASVSSDGHLSIHRLHRSFQTKFIDENVQQPTYR